MKYVKVINLFDFLSEVTRSRIIYVDDETCFKNAVLEKTEDLMNRVMREI